LDYFNACKNTFLYGFLLIYIKPIYRIISASTSFLVTRVCEADAPINKPAENLIFRQVFLLGQFRQAVAEPCDSNKKNLCHGFP